MGRPGWRKMVAPGKARSNTVISKPVANRYIGIWSVWVPTCSVVKSKKLIRAGHIARSECWSLEPKNTPIYRFHQQQCAQKEHSVRPISIMIIGTPPVRRPNCGQILLSRFSQSPNDNESHAELSDIYSLLSGRWLSVEHQRASTARTYRTGDSYDSLFREANPWSRCEIYQPSGE